MRLSGAPAPPRSSLDRGPSPTDRATLDRFRRRAWHEQGVVVLALEEIGDPWLRQALANEAARRWGKRGGQG